MTKVPKCPICKEGALKGSPYFPFCSERCKVIDLGSWAAEKYKVPDKNPVSEEELEAEMERKKGWKH